ARGPFRVAGKLRREVARWSGSQMTGFDVEKGGNLVRWRKRIEVFVPRIAETRRDELHLRHALVIHRQHVEFAAVREDRVPDGDAIAGEVDAAVESPVARVGL